MSERNDEIVPPVSDLVQAKFDAYLILVQEMQEFRRIYWIRNRSYSSSRWAAALANFYDLIFAEAQNYKENGEYKESFDFCENMGVGHCNPEELMKHTRVMMKFAHFLGISKVPKLGNPLPPGATYDG